MIVRKQVTPEGTVPGLETMAGEEVIVVRARTERVAKALEKPLMVLDDIRRYVREHRDLTSTQLNDFTARYGNPADKAREYARAVPTEDFKAKVRELNDFVEKRLDGMSKDLEKRYEDLEREVETAIERIFAGAKKPEGVAEVVVEDAVSVTPEAATDGETKTAGKSAAKRSRPNGTQ